MTTWVPEGSGVFAVKSVWSVIRVKGNRVNWGELVWTAPFAPKCSFITWLGIRGKLSTLDKLKRWGISLPNRCSSCREGAKSLDRLFFGCSFSTFVWENLLMRAILIRGKDGFVGEEKGKAQRQD